jgi:uncharacterized protein (TIGR02266 family)
MAQTAIPLVVPVRFTGGGLAMQTTSSRLGLEGVFVRCLVAPKEGASVDLTLTLPGATQPASVSGVVKERVAGSEPGFWVEFENLDAGTRALIEAALDPARAMRAPGSKPPPQPDQRPRAFPRVQTRLQVGWSTAKEFLVAYAENISRGGIFVATQNPPAVHEVVELLLELPDGQAPVKVNAEVVQCVPADVARATGRTPGAGLQFIGGDEDFRRRVDACIEHLLDQES